MQIDLLREYLAQTTDAARGAAYLKKHYDIKSSNIHEIAQCCFDLLASNSSLHALVCNGEFELLMSMQSFLPWYLQNNADVPMLDILSSAKRDLLASDSTSLLGMKLDSISELSSTLAKTDL